MRTFSGGGGRIFCCVFPRGNFRLGGQFLGENLSGEILHWRNLPEFLYKILFYVLLSLLCSTFTRGVDKGNCPD